MPRVLADGDGAAAYVIGDGEAAVGGADFTAASGCWPSAASSCDFVVIDGCDGCVVVGDGVRFIAPPLTSPPADGDDGADAAGFWSRVAMRSGVAAPKNIPNRIGTTATTVSARRENTFAAGGRSLVTRQANI